jgi:hypothetical protein
LRVLPYCFTDVPAGFRPGDPSTSPRRSISLP